jgi:hypothetical protein
MSMGEVGFIDAVLFMLTFVPHKQHQTTHIHQNFLTYITYFQLYIHKNHSTINQAPESHTLTQNQLTNELVLSSPPLINHLSKWPRLTSSL